MIYSVGNAPTMNGALTGDTTEDYSPDAHDQVDHWNGVQIDSPECHEAQDSNLDADNGECDPERADGIGDKDEWHEHHDASGDGDTLDGCWQNNQELVNRENVSFIWFQCCTLFYLVKVNEVWMENSDIVVGRMAYCAELLYKLWLVVRIENSVSL